MTKNSHLKKPLIVLAAVLVSLLTLFVYNYIESERQFKSLQTSLGTSEEPLRFMAKSIKPGMARDEVRLLIKGYVRLKTLPPDDLDEGGADLFEFSFGIPLLPGEEPYGTIVVSYDRNGRVKGEAAVDIN
ncbi:MAG: hypothetical protein M1453_15575 [Acidobacteria bacterium]|nr:hypothetical protein [Acidobacteriota bacterium]MCL5289401.1 hypothetical protein [Acidobacteriota bacterium]